MVRLLWFGVGLLAVGLAGYVVGVIVEYPGRAFSVTAILVGLTLLAIDGRFPAGDSA